MYKIINFKTIRYKLTDSGKFIHLTGYFIFMIPFSFLRQPKNKKNKNSKFEKIKREMCQPLENEFFSEELSFFNYFFNSGRIVFFVTK